MALTKPKQSSFDISAGSLTSAQIKALGIETASFADLAVTVDKANLAGATYPGFEEDVALLGFKVASNGSLGKYDLIDQTVDAFEDADGIDASASTNETRNSSGKYYSGKQSGGNYFGDGSDGALSTSGNVTHTVQNKNGSYDGDMVVKQYSSLTINAGHTMTVDQPCRGMFIYVDGDCTINGTLSMTAKGGLADPTASGGSDSNAVGAPGLQLGLVSSGGSSSHTNDGTSFNGAGTAVRTATANQANLSSNGTIFTMSRTGGAGGAGVGGYVPNGAVATSTGTAGTAGATGAVTISTGGGGAGGDWRHHGITGGPSGAGGTGGAFSGGAGGGATVSVAVASGTGNAGGSYGGAGGAGKSAPNAQSSGAVQYMAGGGAGNPGGPGASQATVNVTNPPTGGVGGIIWLVVNGTLTVGSGGSIVAQGSVGALHTNNGANAGGSNGGSSGGGAIFALSGGTFTNNGTISSTGGAQAATSGPNGNGQGGAGGAGGVHSGALIAGDTYTNMTLVSNSTTAQSAPTKGDVVMTYSNGAGTAVINTDITAEFSADNGSTWTAMTLASQGTTGGHTILSAHDVTRTSTSGTSMRYRVKTLNQSASKITRVHAVSLGWS